MPEDYVKEIATKVNKKINIPFFGEKAEQKLLEVIIGAVLGAIGELIVEKFEG